MAENLASAEDPASASSMQLEKTTIGVTRASPERDDDTRRRRKTSVKEEEVVGEGEAAPGSSGGKGRGGSQSRETAADGGGGKGADDGGGKGRGSNQVRADGDSTPTEDEYEILDITTPKTPTAVNRALRSLRRDLEGIQ